MLLCCVLYIRFLNDVARPWKSAVLYISGHMHVHVLCHVTLTAGNDSAPTCTVLYRKRVCPHIKLGVASGSVRAVP